MALTFGSFLLYMGALAVCFLIAVYIYFQKVYTYWKKRNVPYIKPIFPFGNMIEAVFMRKTMGELIDSLYKSLEGEKFGGAFTFSRPVLFLRDPDLIKTILIKDFSSFQDRGFYLSEEVEPMSGQLAFLTGARWRNVRVKLTPTFTSGKMKMMFQTLVDCGIQLQNVVDNMINEGNMIEMKDLLARYSTDVISSCAFGIECNCLKNPDAEFRQWGRKIFQPSIKMNITGLLSVVAPSVIDFLGLSLFDAQVSKYFRKMVRETMEYREKNNVRRNDFMQLLIQLKNQGFVSPDHETDVTEEQSTDTTHMTVDNLAAQAFAFFTAGFEPSATSITFCLYELSLHPEIQEKVREEITTVLEKHDGKVTYESLVEMNYLDKVLSEILRKYPPAPMITRDCTNDYTIPETDIIIKKGTSTMIPIFGIHRDPKYFPEPEKFDPDRFSDEEKKKRHPYAYLPFGEGPRICIGMRFALLQIKVGLVSLLSKFQFSVSEKTPIPLVLDKGSFILSPEGGMWLQITKFSESTTVSD